MSAKSGNQNTWILLIIVASSCFFVHLVRCNWTLHARFNLLLQGHVFCHLEPPSQFKEPPITNTIGFISKWVYLDRKCIGYVNPYGEFISTGMVGRLDPLNNNAMVSILCLFYLEWMLIIILVAICTNLVWRKWTTH